MRYIVLIFSVFLTTPAWGLSLSTCAHMQEHISVFDQVDSKHSTEGSISSHVESLPLPDHYLQGSADAYADANGLTRVFANSTTDMYDGVQTSFRSTSAWSETFVNDSADTHYSFNFTLSDIQYGASWVLGTPKVGYELDISLNGNSIYDYSFLYDTSEQYQNLMDRMRSGNAGIPSNDDMMADVTMPDISILLDLGSFGDDDNFTLTYSISSYALPSDGDYAYAGFSMIGDLSSSTTTPASDPVPEPATILLLVAGGVGSLFVNKKR